MDALPPLKAYQQRGIDGVRRAWDDGYKKPCLVASTGGGKSRCMIEHVLSDIEAGRRAIVYANRKLLLDQLSTVFGAAGIWHGRRRADYSPDFDRLVQISSIATDYSRVIKRCSWEPCEAQRVYIDELHENKGRMAQELLNDHLKRGALAMGMTATPLGVEPVCDKLVIACTKKECRDEGMLVAARHICPDEPDMRDFKTRTKTGEYKEGDIVRAIMTPTIFGRVLEYYCLYNPTQRPTLLFAPGVDSSIWFAEQFHAAGIRSAHIDGKECWLDGKRTPSTRTARDNIIDLFKQGEVKVISNRFVMRAGIDIPCIEHIIFATVMRSITAFFQAGGRGLRASAATGKKELLVQDHGGMSWRIGSLNVDWPWELGKSEEQLVSEHQATIRANPDKQPIRCPACSMMRQSGSVCPGCGHAHERHSRMVMQQDGTLHELTDDIWKPRKVSLKSDTLKAWESAYYGAKKSGRTFRQAFATFKHREGYDPPFDLPLMPLASADTYMRVADVPYNRLVSREVGAE